jgi:thioredoxin-like negative regulator of GroEL
MYMKKKELREYISNIISKKLSENKELTREGIVSSILDHFADILHKSNNKRFQASLERIAAESPRGKAAVENLFARIKSAEAAVKMTDDLMKKYDFLK